MLTNNQMVAGRYLRWHRARRTIADIRACLRAGGTVVVATYTHAMQFGLRHVDDFKATRSGAYRRAGRNWVCIDGCAIKFYRARKVA